MFKIKNVLLVTPLFFSLLLSQNTKAQSVDPLADGIKTCGLPVCSIDTTVSALKNIDSNSRYKYTNKLVVKYKDEKEVKILNNLLEIGLEIKSISLAMNDPDWILREVSALANNAIFNLAKFTPLKAVKIMELFKKLDSATKRFGIISYYQNDLRNIESIEKLEQLVAFAQQAKDYTIRIKDEGWITRSASSLASSIKIKLVALDPIYEGVYDIIISDNKNFFLPFDKIVIFDSNTDNNLIVNFINTKYNTVVFSYSHSIIIGNKIVRNIVSSENLSYKFDLSFSRTTGYISTARFEKISFKGAKQFSLKSIFEGTVPYNLSLSLSDVIEQMSGEVLGVEGELSIQSFSPEVYSATFVASDNSFIVNFQGVFYPENGVLVLTHKNEINFIS